jgi:hypothetical protein
MIWGRGVPMPLVGWRECRNAWRDKEGGQEGDVYETGSGVEEGGIRREGRKSKFLLMLF